MVYGMYIQHSLEIKSPWNWLDLLPRTRVCWYVLLTVSINNRTRSGIYKHWYSSRSRACLLYPEVNLQTPSAQGRRGTEGSCTQPLARCPRGRAGRPYGTDHVCPSGTSQRAVFHFSVHSVRKLFSLMYDFFAMLSSDFTHIKNTIPEGPNVKIVVLYWLCKFHTCSISLVSTLVLSP